MFKQPRLRALAAVLAALALIGCAKDESAPRANRTQREKDSIIANSKLPGARAVKRSMTSADSATARQLRLDSAEQEN